MNQLKLLLNRLHLFFRYKQKNNVVDKGILLLYVVLITILSLDPHAGTSTTITFQDKIQHISAYTVFTFLGWRATQTHKTFLRMALYIFLYGCLLEFIQSFTGRTMSVLDILANTMGISIILVFFRQGSSTTN